MGKKDIAAAAIDSTVPEMAHEDGVATIGADSESAQPLTITIPAGFEFAAKGVTLDPFTVTDEGLLYLLTNGYNQAIGDAYTSAVAKAKDSGDDWQEAGRAAAELKSRKICDGTASVRGGGARSTLMGVDAFVMARLIEAAKLDKNRRGKWPSLRAEQEVLGEVMRDTNLGRRVEAAARRDYEMFGE